MTLLSKIAAKLNTMRAKLQLFFSLFLLSLQPIGTLRYHSLAGNVILDPIFNFFKSIWSGFSDMWKNFTSAVGNWFTTVFSYKYGGPNGIPVGPLLFLAILVAGFLIVWGFFKVRQWTRTD